MSILITSLAIPEVLHFSVLLLVERTVFKSALKMQNKKQPNGKPCGELKLRFEIEAKGEFKRLQANICLQDVSIKEDLLDR